MAGNTNTTIIRTLAFLPEIFQTPSNSQFLQASLDQLVNPPIASKIQGYIGSKFGYGVNANDYYVTEPTKTRRDYQLDPGVVFTAPADSETLPAGSATDFISYPGMIDALTLQGGVTDDNSALFTGQFYSWDSFTDLDKLINFNEYYWLPEGPPSVQVAPAAVFTQESYIVTPLTNGYQIAIENQTGSAVNPVLTLIRGGTYTFTVDQASRFWIQTLPGTAGVYPTQQNRSTRDVYGVINNGAEVGVVTFNVPQANAQDGSNITGNLVVDLVSTTPFANINGQLLSSFGNIDGVTSLNGLTVMFYGPGLSPTTPTGYVASGFDQAYTRQPAQAANTMVEGVIYKIATVGTVNWTSLGLTVPPITGGTFTYNGAAVTGTGTVTLVEIPYDTNDPVIQAVTPLTYTVGSTTTDSLTLINGASTTQFNVNDLVTFTGAVLGGIEAGEFYYIAEILNSTDFSVSATAGGPPLALIPDSGSMTINFDNVPRLQQEVTAGAVVDFAGTRYITLTSGTTNNMVANTTVTFSAYDNEPVIGGVTVGQVYFIKEILDGASFSISDIVGGASLPLTVETGVMTVNLNQGQLDDGFTTTVRDNFYTIQYEGDPANPVIRLFPAGAIPLDQRITPRLGHAYNNIPFYRSAAGVLQEVPAITAPLSTLYYQDGSVADRAGVIKLIDANIDNNIDVPTQILGQVNYTSPNGVAFTNGLKVQFNGNVTPAAYLSGEYYVQGVGTSIFLVPVNELVVPEQFTQGNYIPWDSAPWDIGNWEEQLFIPAQPDYITIARDSLSRNPWSRSNRWFHIDVINAAAAYNNNPAIATTYATGKNKASRPIIEFYPNLKLFNSGILGVNPVDFIDRRTTNAVMTVAGALNYYPDIQVYSTASATIAPATAATTTTITIPAAAITGGIENLMYIADSLNQLPVNTTITGITGTDTLTLTVSWPYAADIAGGTMVSIVASAANVTAYALFPGARVIFAADANPTVRNKIYVAEFSTTQPGAEPVITLTVAEDGNCLPENQTVITRGYNYQGFSFWYDGVQWIQAQNKTQVIQPPLFDIFNSSGVSLGDKTFYNSSSFVGSKLFSYAIGSGSPDPVLGFPVAYSSIANAGDISFDVSLNSDTFTYVSGSNPITENVNTGYVYNYTSGTDHVRQLGWQTAVAPSQQYQIFSFDYDITKPVTTFVCDIAALAEPTGITKSGAFRSGVTYTITFVGTTDFTSFGAVANIVGETFVANLNTISIATMNSGFEYEIITLGSTDWNTIGYNGTPVVGGRFIYNGAALSGNGTVSGANAGSGITNSLGWPTVQVYDNNRYLNPKGTITIFAQTMVTGFTYKIATLGITNWTSIGYTGTPAIGGTFTYNGAAVTGDGTVSSPPYVVSTGTNNTTVSLAFVPGVNTVIQVLLLSNQVSQHAYYSIPINLSNNPFNTDPTTLNYGDISNQYRDIFINAPNTVGNIYGANNYRDCGNLVPYGTRLIQNSASLALPGALLRSASTNIFDALQFNSREYVNYKQLIVATVQNSDFSQRFTPSQILNSAVLQITAALSEINSFFWSDMLPAATPYISNTYTFNNGLTQSIYPLSQIYNFSTANYNGVLVYLYRVVDGVVIERQLTSGVDYVVSTVAPSLTITATIQDGDQVIINEFNQTYGSYVPNTPTKLGLYPAFQPGVVLDKDYQTPTYFIRGHDGSFTRLYGEYDPVNNILFDFRDQALLEFELRIYNNLKLSTSVPVTKYEVVPGFFRTTSYTWSDFITIYSPAFLNWVGQNRIDYKTQYFNKNDPFTFNYTNTSNKLNGSLIQQGYWRGIYEYFYDTTTPNETPWEMLGFTDQPTWWTQRYGPAPYTSDNFILWSDLEAGYIWNAGDPYVNPQLARPGLLTVIPVDSNGALLPPITAVLGNYTTTSFQRDWIVGDDAAAELSYRRSSTYPFDLMRIFALTKPAEFFNLGVDLDNYKYNKEFNQYLINDRSHLVLSNIAIYGNGTAKTSYLNWIVDYQKQQGIDATNTITALLNNLDVRLVYRLAGYSAQEQLQFFVEKPSPTNINSSLLIPNESYSILLYNNQPFDKIVFSGVVVQQNNGYWTVFGNSQDIAYFETLAPKYNGKYNNVTILNQTVRLATDYYTTTTLIPYGTKFYNTQDLAQFLMSYGAKLQSQGMLFSDQSGGVPINWENMVYEFLYWTQTGWTEGSIITLNPAAAVLEIDPGAALVQPLTVKDQNFILNQNLYPINMKDLAITRDGTLFTAAALNTGDALAYGQFKISNFENGIVFDNVTIFNDVIYSLVTGLRQNRINMRGTKSAQWNGTVNAWGFIYNQTDIQQWNGNTTYTKGEIVLYKNSYYAAQQIVQPAATFNQAVWKLINYNPLQPNLLANPSTRAYESVLYYDIYQANLQQDADLLAFSLIGYRPRDYLSLIDLTDVAQVQVYQNMIINKGTLNAIKAFNGANLPQGGIQYTVYENWSIKTGDYGGVLNQNFVDFRVNRADMTGDPSIVSLTDGTATPPTGTMQVIPTYNLYNYGSAPASSNILTTLANSEPTSTLYPSAGYVNFDDVEMSAYFYSGLPLAVNGAGKAVPIQNFYVGQYLWLANFKERWEVYGWNCIGQVISIQNNLNQTVTVTFNQPHGLKALDPLAIINFATAVDGYYLVVQVVNLYQVTINLSLTSTTTAALQGLGLGLAFESHRVAKPAMLSQQDLITNEFINNLYWVDENTDGNWAVYKKTINYLYQDQLEVPQSIALGTAVAYTADVGYLVSDPGLGVVYRYTFNALSNRYDLAETLTQSIGFGSKIVYTGNLFFITQPSNTTSTVYVYTLNNTVASTKMLLVQTLVVPANANSIAVSGDANWLYIADANNNIVYKYYREYTPLSGGYFTDSETYEITDLGTTDFVSIGAPANQIGIVFQTNLSNQIAVTQMVSGCVYTITAWGQNTNWSEIGYSGPPATGVIFTYNGAAVTGSGTVSGAGLGTGAATQISYALSSVISGVTTGAVSGDQFGYALSTNYEGDTVLVGAPFKNHSQTIENWGTAYLYQRAVQNLQALFANAYGNAQTFTLAWTTSTINQAASAVTSNYIFVNDVTGFKANDAVIFANGSAEASGIALLTVYYIGDIDTVNNSFTVKASRSASVPVTLTDSVGLTCTVYVQAPRQVYRNGIRVTDDNYASIGAQFYYLGVLFVGDIIRVNGGPTTLIQTFNSNYTNRTGVQFSYATEMDTFGTNILIGSPYEINPNGEEGAIYSYINGGARYGTVIGSSACQVTGNKTVLINGFAVTLTAGDAASAAATINASNIINIQAAATHDNKLIIQLVDKTIAPTKSKLIITALDSAVLPELGIQPYTQTQTIVCPHANGPTEFGSSIKINGNSVVISAPVGTRYESTVFDFNSADNLYNDTVFDNNATQFVDAYPNAGAVYMFDYLANYNENLSDPGSYIYAQATNDILLDYGYEPRYGSALDFNNNVVVIGTPGFMPVTVGGQVVTYKNDSGNPDWSVYRSSAPVVNINTITNTQLYSATTNETLVNLDYIDPLQGKILGVARENLDYVAGVDPAKYNVDLNSQSGMLWGAGEVGRLWFDTTNVRFVNYHQNDIVYNSKYWGAVFPGSDVAVYSWIASFIPPVNYQGPGVPYDVNTYVVNNVLDASGIVTPVYYFWARNTDIIFSQTNKTLSDSVIASYIAAPRASGISYVAPLLPSTFAMYNSLNYFNATDTVFHIGFNTGTTTDVYHQEFALIEEGNSESFLPGLPAISLSNANNIYGTPYSLYARMLDSLAGCDPTSAVVPDPFLPLDVQSGVFSRPKQSFFYDRLLALKNYLTFANTTLSKYPILETREELSFLYAVGPTNPSNGQPFYDTTQYWSVVNWYAAGYNSSIKPAIQVAIYADLAALTPAAGTLVKVLYNGKGNYEIYSYAGSGTWTRVALENGTIQFSQNLWDYAAGKTGWAGNFFDTAPWDQYPSEETRNIIRALNEQIYIGDLIAYRNASLILLFSYIQSEAAESQNFLPWLNKTSLVNVAHTIRELLPYETYRTDNQVFLSSYINETKPYHVVISDFLFEYTGNDVFEGDITDFDVPAQYNSQYEKFISPQLVNTQYGNPPYEYTLNDPIWQAQEYNQWYNNYGTSITGIPGFNITKLGSYITNTTAIILVDNASGFPINGVITIGTEQIRYTTVDRATNTLRGITRGVNGTVIADHLPGTNIYIDLPGVLVLYGARGYINTPKVTAHVDTSKYPAPREAAVLEAVMNIDSVLQITVQNPGQGYAVTPEIRIEPAETVYFNNTDIDTITHVIGVSAPNFTTGDFVQYFDGAGPGTGKLFNGQWYCIHVIETSPLTVIALYNNYRDAISDNNRILIFDAGISTGMTLNLGARAFGITTSSPTRENNLTIKYDRTTYTSQVQDWKAAAFYGSYFAGNYNNSDAVASSIYSLQNVNPDIGTILASAQGIPFEVAAVSNTTQLSWSSFTRLVYYTNGSDNSIILNVQDGNNNPFYPEPNAAGGTLGFYVGMPIRFVGNTNTTNIVVNTVYYVAEILNEIAFTISETPGGPVFSVGSSALPIIGMQCEVGEVVDTTIVTINYPGILQATATQSVTNAVTIPLTDIGTGGTIGFYPDLPIFFTGTMMGGIVENQTYYVTSVIDDQNFTMSLTENALNTTVTVTASGTDSMTVGSTAGFVLNNPVIITQMTVAGSAVTDFGNITSGKTYYVRQIINSTELTISETINGPAVALADQTGTATMTSQVNTVKLSTGTGSMTANVLLPVSPAQVNGQHFTFYNTSSQYVNISNGVPKNLIVRNVDATIAGLDRVAITADTGGIAQFYENLPIRFGSPIGGLSTDTTYYVLSTGTVSVNVIFSSSTLNQLTCDTTASLYVGMPLVFSGVGLGGIVIGYTYFVYSINDATHFSVSADGATVFILENAGGTMTGTGSPFITVSTTPGGPVFGLSSSVSKSTLTQYLTGEPVFSLSNRLGGYIVVIENPGSGFAVNNMITISGTEAGGATPKNDITLTVNTIGANGEIASVIVAGTPNDLVLKYYLKVYSPNQLEVYADPLLEVPVSLADFPYKGFTSAVATQVAASGTAAWTAYPVVQLISVAGFSVNDTVVFTGAVFGNIVLGYTYYITEISTLHNEIVISTLPAGSPFTTGSATGNMLMAKAGSYAVLPEPFYFKQSIVRYANRVWRCNISNNDSTFIFGKWELLDSGDSALNAMDRTIGYYQPTANMPGVDLTQLFEGVTYPNNIYYGNQFQPALQYPLDTVLQDQPFSPTVSINGLLFDADTTVYYAVGDLTTYSAILKSIDLVNWHVVQIVDTNAGLTGITLMNGRFVVSATDTAVPVFTSTDGVTWTTGGYFPIADTSLHAVMTSGGTWIAAGDFIVRSIDGVTWTQVHTYASQYQVTLRSVTHAAIPYFVGYIAVGTGKQNLSQNVFVPGNIISRSYNGVNWTDLASVTPNGLYAVASDNASQIIAVGENGVIYTTANGSNWVGVNQVTCVGVNQITNTLNVTNTTGFAVDSPVVFSRSFSSITADTVYYIADIVSLTQVQISDTLGGAAITLTYSTIPAQTMMSLYETTSSLYSVTYANGTWVAVGAGGTIVTSSDGATWTAQVSNTIQDLYSVSYVINPSPFITSGFIATGENSAIVTSTDGITWTVTGKFDIALPDYTVRGDPFVAGYGPEELVPGVVRDNLAMIVNTRPGSDWNVAEYAHTGYNIVSTEFPASLGGQSAYSFKGAVSIPAQVFVQTIDPTTGLGTTLSQSQYTVDWVRKIITLASPTLQAVRVDVYEIGNGMQLIKSNTDYDPIRTNSVTGFNEIYLNCRYSATFTSGSGALQPNGSEVSVWSPSFMHHNGNPLKLGVTNSVSLTSAYDNTLLTISTAGMNVGDPVVFSTEISALSPVIVPATTYYVATIASSTKFTISLTQGGPIVPLTNGLGIAYFVTNAYAFNIQPDGVSAVVIFSAPYSAVDDYLVYSILGQTVPTQYGYTVPETQEFVSTGSAVFAPLTNNINSVGAYNAVVEINGTRQTYSSYTIDTDTSTLTFTTAPIAGDIVSVTTYNDTNQQYFNTQYGITGATVNSIQSIDTTFSSPVFTYATATDGTSNQITATSTAGFGTGQTVQFNGTAFGGITAGVVYFVDNIVDDTHFTIVDQYGAPVPLTTVIGSQPMQVVEGGLTTARIHTAAPNGFSDGQLIRIDAVMGTTQLNGNYYYARCINDTIFDIYLEPYSSVVGATNYPVNSVSAYLGSGYAWPQGTFYLITNTVTATAAVGNAITVDTTVNLVPGTPIYFAAQGSANGSTIIGGLIQGQEYYVQTIRSGTTFSVSATRDGPSVFLTTDSGTANATQWNQTNVDRLWITVDGNRVPSSEIKIYDFNEIGILVSVQASQEIIMTSMIPSATPSAETYINFVDPAAAPAVYQTNAPSRTWLTSDLVSTGPFSGIVGVADADALVNNITQVSVVPAVAADGYYYIGLSVDKNTLNSVIPVYTLLGENIPPQYWQVVLVDNAPMLRIASAAQLPITPPGLPTEGESITIYITEGNMIFIDGEIIRFQYLGVPGEIGIIQRGVNGTGVHAVIPKYAAVSGLQSKNRLPDLYYNKTWNSYNYNPIAGDPLQISNTVPANFLRTGVS
jgi:hypothetical protein